MYSLLATAKVCRDSRESPQDITHLSCEFILSPPHTMLLSFLSLESGFLNIVMRPLGGYFGDVLYRSFGSKGQKIWMISCGLATGIALIAGGFYLQKNSNAQRVYYQYL